MRIWISIIYLIRTIFKYGTYEIYEYKKQFNKQYTIQNKTNTQIDIISEYLKPIVSAKFQHKVYVSDVDGSFEIGSSRACSAEIAIVIHLESPDTTENHWVLLNRAFGF